MKCENENVSFLAEYAKHNAHGPLGRNRVFTQLHAGVNTGVMVSK